MRGHIMREGGLCVNRESSIAFAFDSNYHSVIMNKVGEKVATELITRQAAAAWLMQQFPDKNEKQWALWLRNNANSSRPAVYRLTVEMIGRNSFYSPEELARFAEFEKSLRLGSMKLTGKAAEVVRAFGIGTGDGSATGRKFDVTAITSQIDEATGAGFVQLVINNPLMVFRLPANDAEAVAKQLLDAAQEAEREAAHMASILRSQKEVGQ